MTMLPHQHPLAVSRRELFQRVGAGVGSLALAELLARELPAEPANPQSAIRDPQSPLASRSPHHPARAKSVIFVHLVGAPSQLDLFEHKPALNKYDGELCPEEYLKGQRFAFLRGHPKLMGSSFKFQQHGESGVVLSELLPHLATVADELAVIKTVQTEQFNHAPAQLFFHTGFGRFGRPTLGSWLTYGLGTENQDLPAFVVMITGQVAGAGNSLWGSGFLPTVHQGIEFRSSGEPVLFLSNPQGVSTDDRRRIVESINRLNEAQLADVGDPEIATRISQYEMAFRMQASVPELMDISRESPETLASYGAQPGKASFANNCLLARRLVERGVRFVQLMDEGWDHHGSINTALPKKCQDVDQPLAALIQDLKQCGLLDETLVVWGSEFGRTPMLQSDREKAGRDHHKDAYCVWLAGGGVKPGVTVGQTDELGYYPTEDAVHVHDLHATLLHLLGLDHERLTYKFQGRNFRLTDVAGKVVEKVIG
jgi:uncharacterized protein (DUF1501 family)